MQSTDALVLQSQSARPCLDFSRLKLYRIHLHAIFHHTTVQRHCKHPGSLYRPAGELLFYCFYFQSPVFSLYLSVLFFMWWIMICANAGFFVWGLWWFFSFGQWSVPYSCRKLRKRSRAELLFLTASSVRVSDVCLLRWVMACPVPLLLTSWARHEFFS